MEEANQAPEALGEEFRRQHDHYIHHNYTDAQIHPEATELCAEWVRIIKEEFGGGQYEGNYVSPEYPGDQHFWFKAIREMLQEGVIGEGTEI